MSETVQFCPRCLTKTWFVGGVCEWSDGHRWRQGDRVMIAIGPDSTPGVVILASGNGKSLMLEFEAILHGHVGTMPVLLEDDGCFRSVVTGEVVTLLGE
jgi:hypothetical protein